MAWTIVCATTVHSQTQLYENGHYGISLPRAKYKRIVQLRGTQIDFQISEQTNAPGLSAEGALIFGFPGRLS
jgi:hypothetical protein